MAKHLKSEIKSIKRAKSKKAQSGLVQKQKLHIGRFSPQSQIKSSD